MSLKQTRTSRSSRNKKSGLILQHLTSEQKLNLKKQYDIWTKQAIQQMQKNAITNVAQRIPIMLNVANNKTKQYQSHPLVISKKEENYVINKVHSELATWKGIQIGTCKTEKNEFNEYSNTARNWFNRNKSKIYDLPNITKNNKIILFVDILEDILKSTVQYKRSKAHPLIPHQTFIQHNLFRKSCADLCKYYNIKCDTLIKNQKRQPLPNGQYAKNENRSKDVNNTFLAKIEEIKQCINRINMCEILPSFTDCQITNTITNTITNISTNKQKRNSGTDNPKSYETIHFKENKKENNEISSNQRKYKIPKFNQTCSESTSNSSQNNGDRILQNALDKSLTTLQSISQTLTHTFDVNNTSLMTPETFNLTQQPVDNTTNNAINNTINNTINNIINPPIMTISQNARNTNVNNYNYAPNRGQNMVSYKRYSPLNVSLNQNMDGTVSISLHNVNQIELMKFISFMYGSNVTN